MASRRITVEIIGDTKSVERAFGRVGKQAETLGTHVRRGARVAGVAILGGLAVAAKTGVQEFMEMQKAAAQTRAVLRSTGRAAGVTADHVSDLADSLLKVSGVDDEIIQQGENMLLTFKNIRNEVGKGNDIFDQATKATLDLSVAMGKDMRSSAILVGKALNDPARGLAQLRRVGVQFTADQEKLIKSLVASGHEMEAQKVILKELNSQFGGSAKAAGETLPGQLAIARESFKNLTAQLVVALIPAMNALTAVVIKVTGFMEKHKTATKILVAALVVLGGSLVTITALEKLAAKATVAWTAATKAATAAQWLFNAALAASPLVLAIGLFAALAAGIYFAYKRSEQFRKSLDAVYKLLGKIGDKFPSVRDAIEAIPGGKGITSLFDIADIARKKAQAELGGGGGGGGDRRQPRAPGPPGLRGPQAVTITGPVNIYGVQNVKEMQRELQREAQRRSGTRRGPNAGNSFGFAG